MFPRLTNLVTYDSPRGCNQQLTHVKEKRDKNTSAHLVDVGAAEVTVERGLEVEIAVAGVGDHQLGFQQAPAQCDLRPVEYTAKVSMLGQSKVRVPAVG